MTANEWGGTAPEHPLSAHECQWVSGTAPEHPFSMHECQWVSIEHPLNTQCVHMNVIEWVWTPIECAWPPLSHYCMQLNMVWPWESSHLCQNWTLPECLWVLMNAFESVLNTPCMLVSAHEHLWVWVSTEHTINTCECMWASMNEWEHPLNTHWMCMNAFD